MKIETKKLVLGTIKDEAAACRAAFKDVKEGAFVLHCHHEILGEILTENAENRIRYILFKKPEHERALRLHLFRPIEESRLKKFKEAYANFQKAYESRKKVEEDLQKAYEDLQRTDADRQKVDADWKKACTDWQKAYTDIAILIHEKGCCTGCTWDGKTIFPK